VELYDLKADPTESNNLAASEPELSSDLLSELVKWRTKNEVPLPPNSVLSH
jgi:hypothetical protein